MRRVVVIALVVVTLATLLSASALAYSCEISGCSRTASNVITNEYGVDAQHRYGGFLDTGYGIDSQWYYYVKVYQQGRFECSAGHSFGQYTTLLKEILHDC